MKLIISPAKKMRQDTDTFSAADRPQFLAQAEEIAAYMRSLDYEACKALWKCNDELAALNFERFQTMDFASAATPALFAYDGIQYQYMAPNVFTDAELGYVREHLRILSGLYGVLRPFDGVVPYRLEMQAKPVGFKEKTLYAYWGGALADALAQDEDCIVNLASKEYSKAVQKYLPDSVRWVDCAFVEKVGDAYKEKATQAKMARGAMVRYLAEIGAESPEQMRGFTRFDMKYSEALSDENQFVFVKGAI